MDVFIQWYKKIQEFKRSKLEKKKGILNINYEKFLLNFKNEKKKINKFINQNNLIKSNFDLEKSKKNLFKAKYQLEKKELNKIENKLRNYLKW